MQEIAYLIYSKGVEHTHATLNIIFLLCITHAGMIPRCTGICSARPSSRPSRRRSIGATLLGSDCECSCANCTRSGRSRRPRTARRPQPPLRRQTRPYCTDASSAAYFNSTRHQQKEANISWNHWELQLYQEKYEESYCTSIALFSLHSFRRS